MIMNEERVVVVTGAARGIGKAISEKFLESGWRVAAADLMYDAAYEWTKDNPHAFAVTCDISSEESVIAATKEIMARFGRIDAIVNNAGFNARERYNIEDFPEDIWLRTIDVNLSGTFRVTKYMGNEMIKSGRGGAIVNLSSISGHNPTPRSSAYGVSKAGIILLTKATALEWGRHHIRCNGICPGQVMTDMIAHRFINPEITKKRNEITPVGRLGKVEDIAELAYFLISDKASYISGTIVFADGGVSLNALTALGAS
jgi:NAD(P)-dependent dehydrogenase (short-subunit alcohol dehydrogenase family)